MKRTAIQYDEISPRTLVDLFNEVLKQLNPPSHLLPFFHQFIEEPINIQSLLVHGTDINKQPKTGSPMLDVLQTAPADAIAILEQIRIPLQSKICHWNGWVEKPIEDLPLNDRQYAALWKGVEPTWEHRYGTYHCRGNFYLYRSGHIFRKFRYKKGDDGIWHITAHYVPIYDRIESLDLLREVYYETPWEVPLVPNGHYKGMWDNFGDRFRTRK